MPNIVPIAQVPLRGHSVISRPPSTAVTMPSASTSQRAGPPPAAAAASSITPSIASRKPRNNVRLKVLSIGKASRLMPPTT